MLTIESIPIGSKNAIRRKTLAMRTGLSDRDLRKEIKELRKEHVIINTQDGNGYFRPSKEDIDLVKKFKAQEESRAKSIFWTLKAVRKFLERNEENGR